MNPNSSAQTDIRTAFGGWSPAWRALTQAQRDGWTTLGAQFTRTDSLGQTYNLTGLQAYVSANQNLGLVGGSAVSTAPALNIPAVPTTFSFTADASPQTLSLSSSVPSAGMFFVVEMTACVSAGRSFQPRSAYKRIFVVDDTFTSPSSILTEYTAIYGALVAGTKIFGRACQVDGNSGQQSPWVNFNTIVSA